MKRTTPPRGDTTTPLGGGDTVGAEGLLDYEGAAEILCCSPRLVRKLAETRQLETVKVASLVRFERPAIARYIERQRRPAV